MSVRIGGNEKEIIANDTKLSHGMFGNIVLRSDGITQTPSNTVYRWLLVISDKAEFKNITDLSSDPTTQNALEGIILYGGTKICGEFVNVELASGAVILYRDIIEPTYK